MSIRSALTVVALCVAPLVAPSVAAADEFRSAAYRDIAERIPRSALTAGQNAELYFVDLAAARQAVLRTGGGPLARLAGADNPMAPFMRLSTSSLASLSSSLTFGFDGAWDELVGFGPSDLRVMAIAGAPPAVVNMLRLADGAVERMGPALLANGYAGRTIGGWQGWERGEADFRIEIRNRNPADPFGGQLGQSSRVATDGEIVLQSAGWGEVRRIISGGPSLADLPAMAVLLDALDDPRFGGARLVQAYLLTTPWTAQADPAAVLLGGDKLPEPGAAGLPPWQMGLLADLSTGPVDHSLALVAYADRATAEGAAEGLVRAWRETGPSGGGGRTFAELGGGEAEAFVVGDGPAALVLAITRPMTGETESRNLAYNMFWNALIRRELDLLAVR